MSDIVIICSEPGHPLEGAFLASFDPDYIPDPTPADWSEHRTTGLAGWTYDPAQAMHFATTRAALECWRMQSTVVPTRLDGRPNRPLTAMTVTIDHSGEQT